MGITHSEEKRGICVGKFRNKLTMPGIQKHFTMMKNKISQTCTNKSFPNDWPKY